MPSAAALPKPSKEVVQRLPKTYTKLPSAASLPAPQFRKRASITKMQCADENERGYSVALPPRVGSRASLRAGTGSADGKGGSDDVAFIIPTALPRPGQCFAESKASVATPSPRQGRKGTPRRAKPGGGATPRSPTGATPRMANGVHANSTPSTASAASVSSGDAGIDEPPLATRGVGACGLPTTLQQEQVVKPEESTDPGSASASSEALAEAPSDARLAAASPGGTKGVDPDLEC